MSIQAYLPLEEKEPVFVPAIRKPESLVAAAEKTVLLWLAKKRWLDQFRSSDVAWIRGAVYGRSHALARWHVAHVLVSGAVEDGCDRRQPNHHHGLFNGELPRKRPMGIFAASKMRRNSELLGLRWLRTIAHQKQCTLRERHIKKSGGSR
jgi:hypothetical protein